MVVGRLQRVAVACTTTAAAPQKRLDLAGVLR